MSVAIKRLADSSRIEVEGEFTVSTIAQVGEALLHAIHEGFDIVVDLERVTEVDISSLQLLCAAQKSVSGLKKSLSLAAAPPSLFRELLEKAGYRADRGCVQPPSAQSGRGCGGNCLWEG
ncbi:MAG: hypothetical protein A4E57_02977 [Syntrophorhabdaceae bacterium PtaU1.Bin034]|jgi:anti-anti-sigma regulatory factor|nr:MAG: hypothetical protein A4E57_02977 [Syntrophorhabdaceae bacterium PtaU1.Bin034]